MKSIFASKLYQASSRKDRINAALANPGNLSLVQQLADSLDEEYQTPTNLGLDDESTSDAETDSAENDLIVDEEINPEEDLVKVSDFKSGGASHHSSSGHSSSSPEGSSGEGSDEGPSESKINEDAIPDSPGTDVKAEPEPTEASTNIHACQDINLTVLKGTLNEVDDTTGVARIIEKDNEIWIHYNDNINLNDIMDKVIESVSRIEGANLEFNRLARSDNAVVFVKVKSA